VKLSRVQLNTLTLLVLAGKGGSSPYSLGASLGTLNALVRRGLAEYRPKLGDMFWPRGRRFVVTDRGYVVHREESHRESAERRIT